MPSINPYLNFKGNAEEAFIFYKSIFGGDFLTVQRFKDTPEASKLPEKDLNKMMHIALPIDNGNILMATDALESAGHFITQGSNFHLSVSTDGDEETRTIFNALAAGGKVTVPLDKNVLGIVLRYVY